MHKLLATLALVASPAYAIQPTALPEGVTADIVDSKLCYGVQRELGDHIRNMFARENAFNARWVQNSTGEMLSFDCNYTEISYSPYTAKSFSIIYRTTRTVIEAEVKREREEVKREILKRQSQVKDSGYL